MLNSFILELDDERASKFKMAACIIHKSDIISIGIAKKKTHPLQAKFSRHPEANNLHAEIDAIQKAIRLVDLSRCVLYVSRVKMFDGEMMKSPADRVNGWGLARPCSGCHSAILFYKIPIVRYTLDSITKTEWAEERFHY